MPCRRLIWLIAPSPLRRGKCYRLSPAAETCVRAMQNRTCLSPERIDMAEDYELEVLLSLDGLEVQFAHGYTVKIAARVAESTSGRPHGVRYSLTLHDAGRAAGLLTGQCSPRTAQPGGIRPPTHFRKSAHSALYLPRASRVAGGFLSRGRP